MKFRTLLTMLLNLVLIIPVIVIGCKYLSDNPINVYAWILFNIYMLIIAPIILLWANKKENKK